MDYCLIRIKNPSKLINLRRVSYYCRYFFLFEAMGSRLFAKIKDIFTGPRRKFAWFVVASTLALVILWIVGPGNTFIHWGRASRETKRQEKVILKLKKENAELDRRIKMMTTDKDTLEKFAREQYNFAAPGEDVYLVE